MGDKHHGQKQLGQEMVYFRLQLLVCHPGKPGQELKAETDAESMEDATH